MGHTASIHEGKKSNRPLIYTLIALVVGAMVAVAYFQEPIGYYFTLQGWDREAPARTVESFLSAGQKGDQATADKHIGTRDLKPLVESGKWVGYSVNSIAGTMEFRFNELAPQGEPKATQTEYTYVGKGSAQVTVPDRSKRNVRYRLEMLNNKWKITEILGGRPAARG